MSAAPVRDEESLRQEALEACRDALDALANGTAAPTAIIGQLQRTLTRASGRGLGEGPVQAYDAVVRTFRMVQARYEATPVPAGIAIGLDAFDETVGGLPRGQLVLLEGSDRAELEPLGLFLAHAAASRGVPTLLRSIEDRLELVTERMLAGAADVLRNLSQPAVWDRLVEKASCLSQAPLWIVADGAPTIAALEVALEQLAIGDATSFSGGIAALIVLDAQWTRGGPSLALARLRYLARERNVAVVATCVWSGDALGTAAGGPDWRVRVAASGEDELILDFERGDGVIAKRERLRRCSNGGWIDAERSNRERRGG